MKALAEAGGITWMTSPATYLAEKLCNQLLQVNNTFCVSGYDASVKVSLSFGWSLSMGLSVQVRQSRCPD